MVAASHEAVGALFLECLSSCPASEDRAPAGVSYAGCGFIEDDFEILYTSRRHFPSEVLQLPEGKAFSNVLFCLEGGACSQSFVDVLLGSFLPLLMVLMGEWQRRVVCNVVSDRVARDVVLGSESLFEVVYRGGVVIFVPFSMAEDTVVASHVFFCLVEVVFHLIPFDFS